MVKRLAQKSRSPRTSAKGLQERSGGTVDAPGKKHRPPVESNVEANAENSQAAKRRTAMTMTKTSRLRGRG